MSISGSFLRLQTKAIPRVLKLNASTRFSSSNLWKATPPLELGIRCAGVYGVTGMRFNSTSAPAVTEPLPTFIEPTSLPEIDPNAPLHFGSFAELGLCNYTPVGLLEKLMEVVAVTTGMPWWATIGVVTLFIRAATLPLIIHTNQRSTRLHNIKPDMDAISARLKRAQESQDPFEIQVQTQKMKALFKTHDINPLSVFIGPLVQAPIMISFFLALRAMAEAPVPFFNVGGLSWITDLTVADPYYILPVLSGLGFLATVELGAEFGSAASSSPPAMRNFLRGLAVITVPATAYLPAAVFLYWIPSNIFSLFQLFLTTNSKARKMLNLPDMIKHPPSILDKKKGFFP
ncbi:hypothetical protein DSO57_1021517 [Entomophthora muscae]|uniref:Uncharacterized protein n=1 Tax=Entomophthora muscae TaxID=34485 RepID=A0ACC2RUL0_9FUNG|nr:hypothetical protein DSO57_1021517 [Entomophthora muscae]